jgi:subtilisin-like proprotein convertase family protein
MLLAAALVFELARESLTGTHYRYREYVDGIVTDEYVTVNEPLRSSGAAGCVIPCASTGSPQSGDAVLPHGMTLRADPQVRFVDGRVVRRELVHESPFEPWAYDYDLATGALLRRTPLFFRAKAARVFDPNPVVTLNDPTLQDQNDSALAVPAAAYFDVLLGDEALHGPHVTLVDRQPRAVAPPEGALVFTREEDGFEDVNAYFHIDRNQRYLQSIGFRGSRAVVPYAIEVDAHAASGSDNSFFIPSATEAGKGVLFFGEGGTDDAEDADLLVHEYAHAIMEWIAPGTFAGAFPSEGRALGEGIADYWAYSAHAAARRASGRDPFCFADWDARCALDDATQRCAYELGADCLRRLDSTRTMADYERQDSSGVEHRNGSIFSSALRQIHDSIGKEVTDTIVIESLFGAPPRPTFADIGARMLDADRLLYQGRYAGAICHAMYVRGILTECDRTPRGEWTHFQGPGLGIPIPENDAAGITSSLIITDTRTIEKLYVRVDIDHPSRGDLRVDLIAPDGTVIALHPISSSRTPDIHETFGLTAMPVQSLDVLRGRTAAGEWKLFVADRRPRDVGTLRSWGLEIQFAGDTPLAVRPHVFASPVIPVVAHVYGQGEVLHRSDLRIANVTGRDQEATLVFTRSGEDGLTQFAAVKVLVPAEHTVAFDDVVSSVFHTTGTGSLEVLGNVLVMSRTDGEAVLPETGAHGTLLVAPIPEEAARYNLGLTETAGATIVVRINGQREVALAPFSHVQFPVEPELLELQVVQGEGRLAAYLAQVGRDTLYIPAQRKDNAVERYLPAITTQTPDVPLWRSDLWLATAVPTSVRVDLVGNGFVDTTAPNVFEDVLARLFHRTVTIGALRVMVPAQTFAHSRIVSGDSEQSVPLMTLRGTEQHLLSLESSSTHRTNIGIVSDRDVTADIVIYDAAGLEVERQTIATRNGYAQTRVRAAVVGGRAVVHLDGSARVFASVIGEEALFVPSQ